MRNPKPIDCKTAKSRLFEKLGQIAHALGSPTRLRILQAVAQSPRSVEEISELVGESVANTSQHLQKLAHESLVFVTKKGLSRIYQITSPQVLNVWESLQDLGHELSPELNECENTLSKPELRTTTPLRTIFQELKAKQALLLDVRDSKEAAFTPIEGSVSIPLVDLKKDLGILDKSKAIYVLCRGRHCTLASDAVETLRAAGFKAYRLQESPFKIQTAHRDEENT